MYRKNVWLLAFIGALLLVSCDKYYVTVKKEPIDRQYLASTFVGSPDPLQVHPPLGQTLFVQWSISSSQLKECPELVLEVVYGDWSKKVMHFPVNKRRGIIQYDLEGQEYKEKEGLFSYRARVQTPDGQQLMQWSQLMWTPLIETEP